MATILAAASGNWSNTATWPGGVIPSAGDVVVANAKQVIIDQSITVLELRTDTTGGALTGGGFSVISATGLTINANLIAGGETCVTYAGLGPLTINGSITGSPLNSNFRGISINNVNQTLNLANGTLSQGASSTGGSAVIHSSSSGSFTLNLASSCNIVAVSPASTNVININQSGNATANITVSCPIVLGGGSGYGISYISQNTNVLTFSATGQISSTSGSGSGIHISNSNASSSFSYTGSISMANGIGIFFATMVATASIVGNLSSTGGVAFRSDGSSITNITGSVTGGSGASQTLTSYTLTQTSGTPTTNVTGVVEAGTKGSGCNITAGIFTATRAKGNGYGLGSIGLNQTYAINSTSTSASVRIQEIECGSLGAFPINGHARIIDLTTNKFIGITTNNTTKTLLDPNGTTGIVPDQNDVRLGVVYSNQTRTGTLAVPPPSAVLAGVAVDNTVGTAPLSAASMRSALGLANPNLDAQFSKVNGNIISSALAL